MTWVWIGFALFILAMLALDLLRKEGEVSLKEAATWSAIWVALAVLFGVAIFFFWDRWHPDEPPQALDKATEFITGYVVELSLSIDNLFVFLVIFQYFGVPNHLRHRALMAGIIFAIVLRIAFILVGAALLNHFHWIIYLFGLFLIWTAYKLFMSVEEDIDPEKNLALRIARRFLPVTTEMDTAHFTVWRDGRRHFTPMSLVLLVIGSTDLVFALDSIPAVFGVTREPFIVLTSNVFAVLGLRSFYFVLSRALGGLRFLKPGLALVLGFVGLKMLIQEPLDPYLEAWGISQRWLTFGSLGVVVLILGVAAGASLLFPEPPKQAHEEAPSEPSPVPGSEQPLQ
jgi:tellurite resistance protein TerC